MSPSIFFIKKGLDVGESQNGHANIWAFYKFNFIATYNIRSPKYDCEKNMVWCKKGDVITPFDGIEKVSVSY